MPEQLGIDYELTNEERMIIDILKDCRGKDNAMIGEALSIRTGIKYDEVRAIISHLVNDHHILIASCSRGYFIPVNAAEVDAATKSLRHRGIMILMRASRLQKTSLEEIFHQARMEYGN